MENNGWTVIQKQSGGNKHYDRYENQIVVIAPVEKSPSHLYLTAAVLDVLGKPEYITFMTRGTNIALVATQNNDAGYKVGKFHRTSLRHVCPGKFLKEIRMRPGVYAAHIEGRMIVFDTAQTPSKV